jgi:hypothetical protein
LPGGQSLILPWHELFRFRLSLFLRRLFLFLRERRAAHRERAGRQQGECGSEECSAHGGSTLLPMPERQKNGSRPQILQGK